MMNSRERFQFICEHREPDRFPIDYLAHPETDKRLKSYYNLKTEKEEAARLEEKRRIEELHNDREKAIGRVYYHVMNEEQRALYLGIEKAKVENRLSDLSHSIQVYAEGNGFSVVRDFVGHGIGKSLHEDPQIPNFGSPHQGPRLRQGMIFALEPMMNAGTWQVTRLGDEWTVVTADGKLSAHFEHSIALTDGDAEILSIE